VGYRANYIVKRAGEWVHTSSQADALEIDGDFIFGPDAAKRFLAPWPQWDFADWQIETSCQAGALVDTDSRVFMLFSDQPGYADRAVLLNTLRRTWAGWSVVWAYNGLADLLRHAGVDPEQGRPFGTRHESALYPFGRSGMTKTVWTLVTVRDFATVRAYGLDGDAVHPWWVGEGVVSMLADDTAIGACPYIPDAGLHLDLRDRSAGLWAATMALHDIAEEWSTLWPGWRLRFWEDDYHRQLGAAAGAIAVPRPDLGAARDRLATRVRGLWQRFLTTNVEAYLQRAGQSIEQLREADWYSFVALQTAVTGDDLDKALAAIRTT
jgi:hypothetical protein